MAPGGILSLTPGALACGGNRKLFRNFFGELANRFPVRGHARNLLGSFHRLTPRLDREGSVKEFESCSKNIGRTT